MTEKTYNLLKLMKERPSMWLGEIKLKSLSSFLMGYQFGLEDQKNNFDKGIFPSCEFLDNILPSYEFHEWIAKRLGYFESTAGWANMILASTIGLDPKKIMWENYDLKVTHEQHLKSFENLYTLVDAYVEEKGFD